ncbi:hypothetical protein AcV5_001094 [Taiwanofungus camphoratus]|nr:hypothetical protein AcW2_006284 [Antrodia cinnamomea]KAI0938256.1 hypothetical protein AcV7_003491 [Antrodia cinnamomea]KAI0939805.1 hypothetical protein AcV5_001094 [Antrodia cinnamomea]
MSSPVSSTIPQSWQQAWENAQPRLSQIRDSLLSTQSPSPRITRVGQLDAELLDQELGQILKEPLTRALALVNSAWKSRFEPELALLIQLTLYKLSVWNNGASYGATLQGLKYAVSGGGTAAASGLPRRTLLVHGVLTLLVPYSHTRLRVHALSHAWPDAPTSDRRRKAWEVLSRLELAHSVLGLLNFVAFLWDGRYRTVVDRLLKMRLVSARKLARRDVSYEFMNRQMVWHAFTEFLLFLLPLINTRALRRRVATLVSSLNPSSLLPIPVRSLWQTPRDDVHAAKQTRRGKYWALSLDQCAICAENASTNLNFADPANALTSLTAVYPTASASSANAVSADDTTESSNEPPMHPIQTAYVTSCGHVYCYYCLSDRMLRTAEERTGVGPGGTQWQCLRCGEGVTGADRVEAEVDGPDYESGVDDGEDELEFEYGSEDMEFTDMSGSVGSYSESGLSE